MKKFIFILIAVLSGTIVSGQQEGGFNVFYGLNVSQFSTGSGHNSSFVMNSSVQKGRKSLEMGLIYQDEQKRFSGADVKYKVFLGKNAFLDNQSENSGMSIRPYVHYNAIYHNSIVDVNSIVPVIGQKKSSHPELPSAPGTIATMEHYAGMGLQMMVSDHFCVDGSMGLGAYIGSLDKYTAPSSIGIHGENHGFVLSFEIGLGYKFGI